MNPGEVVLAYMPQLAGWTLKLRPALFLANLAGSYQTVLLCGISTRWHSVVPAWDELIQPGDPDYASSGLHHPSVIRLSFLYSVEPADLIGPIGQNDQARLDRLRQRLSDHLRP